MDSIIGIAIVLAILAFIVWLIGKIISIALFVVIIIPIYIGLFFYALVQFIAMNVFVVVDKLFYFGFDLPVIIVWAFWGLVIGAAIQGYREMKIYGRKVTGVLIAAAPVLLLALVGAVKITQYTLADPNINAKRGPSSVSGTESMVLIPAGEFQMGSDANSDHESPKHIVYVDAFYMDKYEVTNAQYAAFLNNAKKKKSEHGMSFGFYYRGQIKPINGKFYVRPGYENHPVGGVTWYGAMAYTAWVGKRLPTEAEWEKAARGGLIDKNYPWGDTYDSRKANDNINDYTADGDTTVVGNYPANGYGLYDMAGNVSEWCLDEYKSDFYANSPDKNPVAGGTIASIVEGFAELERTARVFRGSSWSKCATRFALASGKTRYGLGFRCVKPSSPADNHEADR